jgi:hypothetical protein
MSDITGSEKRKFEQLFSMGSGYVLDFSNRTFAELVMDTIRQSTLDKASIFPRSSPDLLRLTALV